MNARYSSRTTHDLVASTRDGVTVTLLMDLETVYHASYIAQQVAAHLGIEDKR